METHICQNCKQTFIPTEADMSFYVKIGVPVPTFCPMCRFQKRMMFRNERVLYKRECGLCKKPIVSIFSPERGLVVYCQKCWWSDEWDPTSYGMGYDPSRNLFDQYRELQSKIPHPNLITDYGTLTNSDYVNHCGHLKDCYLSFNCDFMENSYFVTTGSTVKDSLDGIMWNKVELSYELIDGNGSKILYSENCDECIDVLFSKNCVGCTNCFGCVNLRKKSYHFFNEPCTKEEYERRLAEFDLGSYAAVQAMREQAYGFWLQFPRKAYYGRQNTNSTGDYIYYSKNFRNGYQSVHAEDSAYCQFLMLPKTTDCYDITEWGYNIDLCYDGITVGAQASSVRFCSGVWGSVSRIEYSQYVVNGSEDCFGCIGLKKKKYCILNKEYSPEEYEVLRKKIIEDMSAEPYVDALGRVWKYGDFFPYDLSPFAYNESQAIQYFSMNESDAIAQGFTWAVPQKPNYSVTLSSDDIPDNINDVTDAITKEILECVHCKKVYKIIPNELTLIKRIGVAVPRKCPDCRHMDRMARVNQPYLYERNCMKCGVVINTSYAPERPEIVYCEPCFQNEVN